LRRFAFGIVDVFEEQGEEEDVEEDRCRLDCDVVFVESLVFEEVEVSSVMEAIVAWSVSVEGC
jgi:hypothetical protein